MSETRYAQVARDLTEGITNGRFRVGSLLPTELELGEHYGVSRHTVRAAIRELQELGLVSRRKKVGTRVEAASPSRGYRQSLASVEDLVQFGAAHTRVVREIKDVVADRALARELGCAPGTRCCTTRSSPARVPRHPRCRSACWTPHRRWVRRCWRWTRWVPIRRPRAGCARRWQRHEPTRGGNPCDFLT